jgi:solute carrier family 41
LILDFAVQTLRGVAVFQPVMNGNECIFTIWKNQLILIIGVGGNLVAIQASRLSTALHQQGEPGEFRDKEQYYASTICPNPYHVFCSKRMCTL